MTADDEAAPVDGAGESRQRIERVRGARRARLTPAPGTTAEPGTGDDDEDRSTGANDAQLRRDVPPHY